MGARDHFKNKASSRSQTRRAYLVRQILLLCTIVLLASSCAPSVYYQIYKVQPINDLPKSNTTLIYEDANCEVVYDFWAERGNVGFLLYNKSEKNIYVDMTECFFVCNGIAYDYFQNREFTSQSSTSQSSMYTHSATNTYSVMGAIAGSVAVSGYNNQGFRQTNSLLAGVGASKSSSYGTSKTSSSSNTLSSGVNFKEKEIICIPPKSAKVISEYNVTGSLFRDCNLFLYPSKKQIRTSNFSEVNSPLVFSNRISYIIEDTDDIIKLEHKFYVSEISNYSDTDITELKPKERCKDEATSYEKEKHFKDVSPYKFYIKYNKSTSYTKH